MVRARGLQDGVFTEIDNALAVRPGQSITTSAGQGIQMRKNLEKVPVLIEIGSVPAREADDFVVANKARSVRGRAILSDPTHLEEILLKLDLDAATMKILARGINRLRAERAAAATHLEPDNRATTAARPETMSKYPGVR